MSSSRRVLGVALLAVAMPVMAAEDLRALEVQAQRGQSLEQTRRDRYECHNWAVGQTGEAPAAARAQAEPHDGKRELRHERIDRAIVGAVIGAGVGGLLGHGHSSDEVLAGAAAGAAIGAATAGTARGEPEPADVRSDYLRALTACLEGRGYSVALPTTAELTARR